MIPHATTHLKEDYSEDFLGTETPGSSDVSRDPAHVLVALAAVVTSVFCGVAVSGGPAYNNLCKINFNRWQC